MSDSCGPSEDCRECGQPQSYGHFGVCPRCLKTICCGCIDTHECHPDIFAEEVCPISGELDCGGCPNIDECAEEEYQRYLDLTED